MTDWVKCSEKLPDQNGEYLVVKSIFGMFNKIDLCMFALNLYEVDEFEFQYDKRPGWYDCDSETGYYEWTDITHWAELPEMPEGCDLNGRNESR